jgi:hypothetical protein
MVAGRRWIRKRRPRGRGNYSKALHPGATKKLLTKAEARLAEEFSYPAGWVPSNKIDAYTARYAATVAEVRKGPDA